MHLSDALFNGDWKVPLAAGALALGGLGTALRIAQRTLPPRRMPLMGLGAAFIFAAQMLNFPVIGGTSGHLLGGTLAAVLLGPSAAVVVISAVLIVQCLLFNDGGLLALGANMFNMAIVGTVGAYGIYALVRRFFAGLSGQILAGAFAAWCGTVLAAVCCAAELSLAGTVRWSVVLPAMAGIHMLIGLGEAVITAFVLAGIAGTRPELLEPPTTQSAGGYAETIAYGLVIALGLALFISPLASAWPDGLESVMHRVGFAHEAALAPRAPMPEYTVPGVGSPAMATALAGVIGTGVVFGLMMFLARMLTRSARAGARAEAETACPPETRP